MQDSTSREKILKKIRNALIDKTDNPYKVTDWDSPVYADTEDTPDVAFAREFTRIGGKFVYCESESEFAVSLKELLAKTEQEKPYCLDHKLIQIFEENDISFSNDENDFLDVQLGITRCEYLIARLGSIMVSSAQESGRRLNVYPEIHVLVAYASQIVLDLKDALSAMKKKYNRRLPSMITNIAGPSRTADIEKTLVMGAHGPKELFLFLIEDRNLK